MEQFSGMEFSTFIRSALKEFQILEVFGSDAYRLECSTHIEEVYMVQKLEVFYITADLPMARYSHDHS